MKAFTRRLMMGTGLASVGSLFMARIAGGVQRRADLVVDAIRWSDDQGLTFHTDPVPAGSDVLFQADVRNVGRAGWSPLQILGVGFRVNGVKVAWSDTHRAGLSPGASVTLTANGGPDGDAFWNDAEAGTHTVQAHADDINRLVEANDSNNTRSASITVEEPPAAKPDLVVSAVRWSDDDGETWGNGAVRPGRNVWFEADIHNRGDGATPAGVVMGIDFLVGAAEVSWVEGYSTALPAGQTVSLRANGGPDGDRFWNNAQAGSHILRVRVDDAHRIQESDESNNFLEVPLTVNAGSAPSASELTIGAVSGAGNFFINEAGSHKIADLHALHGTAGRISCHPASGYFAGNSPSPSKYDQLVVSMLNKGIRPYFSFVFTASMDSSQTGIPQRNYADWFAIGQAFANRFKKGSSFLMAQGFPGIGAFGYAAINEPDTSRGQVSGLTYVQYHDILEGLADGVHAADPGGKVWPAGYLSANRDLEYTGWGYCKSIADLINDRTLEGFDLHTYHAKGGAKIHDTYDRSHQRDADRFVAQCGITRQDISIICTETNVRGDPDASAQNYASVYAGSGLTHEQVARNWFMTSMFDVWGCVRPDGKLSDGGPRFPWNVWQLSSEVWWMADQLQPRSECWCGRTYKMLMDLLWDMRFTFVDPKGTGVFKLKGGGKSGWVFQNIHSSWSSRYGRSFTINDIPAGTTKVDVYDGNGLIQTVNNPSKPSHTFSTPVGKSYLFIANAQA